MMTDAVPDDIAIAAKLELDAAVSAYYAVVEPDAYVNGWVLTTHKLSIELASEGTSAVGVLVKTGQDFVATRGLLDVALSTQRASD